jgi:hypothetical protein
MESLGHSYMLGSPRHGRGSLSQESFLSQHPPNHFVFRLSSVPEESEIAISEFKTPRARATVGFSPTLPVLLLGGNGHLRSPDEVTSPPKCFSGESESPCLSRQAELRRPRMATAWDDLLTHAGLPAQCVTIAAPVPNKPP